MEVILVRDAPGYVVHSKCATETMYGMGKNWKETLYEDNKWCSACTNPIGFNPSMVV